jgi:uncharacterized protein (DUF488 family)
LRKRIFTIGTSTREIKEFLQLLSKYNIKNLADVRSFPSSRMPHFCQKELKSFLLDNGVNYTYLGKELGGFRQGGYKKHMQTHLFKEGIDKLEHIANSGNTAYMCAEKFPWRCHRRFISIALQEKGWEVIHIIDSKKIWQPKKPARRNIKSAEPNTPKLF